MRMLLGVQDIRNTRRFHRVARRQPVHQENQNLLAAVHEPVEPHAAEAHSEARWDGRVQARGVQVQEPRSHRPDQLHQDADQQVYDNSWFKDKIMDN